MFSANAVKLTRSLLVAPLDAIHAAKSNPPDVTFGLCLGLGTHHVKTTVQ